MNIAFYVDNIADDNNGPIFDCMNHMVENNEVRDATLFYNDIGPEPKKPSFGVFNATEIWYFTGHVIATTMENWVALKNAVNKFKTKYLYKRVARRPWFSRRARLAVQEAPGARPSRRRPSGHPHGGGGHTVGR